MKNPMIESEKEREEKVGEPGREKLVNGLQTEEIRGKESKMYSWLRRNLSPKKETQNPKSPTEEEEVYGITNQLVEFVKSFTVDTFTNFSLPEEEQSGEAPTTSGGVQVDLSEWQQRHATLVLSKVKEMSQLRFLVCPRHLKERQFWRIYFTLVKNYVIEYELRAIRLEKLRNMGTEDKKFVHTNGIELEMSDTKQRNNMLPPAGENDGCI